MAGHRGLVTDAALYQSLLYQPLGRSSSNTGKGDRELRLATAVFETVMPVGLESVPIDRLLSVQADLVDQRRRFQDKVSALAKGMELLKSDDELREQVDANARKLKDEQDELIDKLRAAKIAFGSALFSVSIPSWVTAEWGMHMTSPSAWLVSAGAVAVSGVVIKSIFDHGAAKRTNPMTYLLNVKKRLKPKAEATRIISLKIKALDQPQGGGGTRRRMGRRLKG